MTAEHPEGWKPNRGAFTQEALEIALEAAREEADRHGGDYAAGMRHACVIIEESLLVDS